MTSCLFCRAPRVALLLDLGPQPIGNRFPRTAEESEATFPLTVGQCGACGLVQLIDFVPAQELRPRVDWITYNEPEGHLGLAADRIAALPGVTRDSAIAALSFKDDPLLRRLADRGFARTWRLDPRADLDVAERGTGIETIVDRLTPERARRVAAARGRADVLVSRHLVHHLQHAEDFAAALRELIRPGGYAALEAPSSERALDLCDYSVLWEESSAYFTPATFRAGLAGLGLDLLSFDDFPYEVENCLLGVARIAPSSAGRAAGAPAEELARARRWADRLPRERERLGRLLEERPRPIAVFGAGHLAGAFINLLRLKDRLDLAVDDNPNKRGLRMPGSRLPIAGSSALLERGVKLALLSVSGAAEEKVVLKNKAFEAAGGAFASIFPASRRALIRRESMAAAPQEEP